MKVTTSITVLWLEIYLLVCFFNDVLDSKDNSYKFYS